MQVHYFDEAGIYTHSGVLPINPVSGRPFAHNPDVCTPDPLPEYDPVTKLLRRVSAAWAVELLPVPEPETPPAQSPDIAELRERAHDQITAWRAWSEQQEITFEHAGRTWDGGFATRNRLKPVLSLSELPEGFFWTDADNNDVPVTAADLAGLDGALEFAMVQEGFRIHMLQRQMKVAVDVMSVDALQDFNPSAWVATISA